MNQIVNMLVRMVMRRAMNWGLRRGAGSLSRGKGAGRQPGQGQMRDLGRRMRSIRRFLRR